MVYWDLAFLIDIGCGIGDPLRIDERILQKELGTYAWLLIDADISKVLLEKFSYREKDLSSSHILSMKTTLIFVGSTTQLDMILVVVDFLGGMIE